MWKMFYRRVNNNYYYNDIFLLSMVTFCNEKHGRKNAWILKLNRLFSKHVMHDLDWFQLSLDWQDIIHNKLIHSFIHKVAKLNLLYKFKHAVHCKAAYN